MAIHKSDYSSSMYIIFTFNTSRRISKFQASHFSPFLLSTEAIKSFFTVLTINTMTIIIAWLPTHIKIRAKISYSVNTIKLFWRTLSFTKSIESIKAKIRLTQTTTIYTYLKVSCVLIYLQRVRFSLVQRTEQELLSLLISSEYCYRIN